MATDTEIAYPLEQPYGRAVGVPHRFSVGVLMLLVTFFSVLFAVMASLGAAPEVVAVVGVLFVGVAVGQSLLYGGSSPRVASILVGVILFPLEMLVLGVYAEATGRLGDAAAGTGVCCALPSGGLLGYAAGVVTAGIFVALERWKARGRKPVAPIELRPFAESDVDTLLGWVEAPGLRQRWSLGRFQEPLGRPQIEQHLKRTAGSESEVRAFLAISSETESPVGYVELRSINRRRQSATIDLALIAPDAPDRSGQSIELLRAVLEVAFGQMKLRRVQAVVPADDVESVGCYKAMGFWSEGVLRDACRRDDQFEDGRIMSRLRHEWLWNARTRFGRRSKPDAE